MHDNQISDKLLEQLAKISPEQAEAIAQYLQEITGEQNNQSTNTDKYLTFWCGDQLFGIKIAQVVQIVQMMEITPLPDYISYIKGVLSIRGEMVPIMDLRLRLGKEEKNYDGQTCIILVRIDGRAFGLIIDGVDTVETIPKEDVCPPPQQSEHKANYLTGIVQREHIILILDMDFIVSEKEIGEILNASDSLNDE